MGWPPAEHDFGNHLGAEITRLSRADEHLSLDDRRQIAAAHQTIMTAMEDVMRQGIAGGDIADRDPRVLAYAFWHWIASFGGRRGADASFQGRPEIAIAVVDLFLHGAGALFQAVGTFLVKTTSPDATAYTPALARSFSVVDAILFSSNVPSRFSWLPMKRPRHSQSGGARLQ